MRVLVTGGTGFLGRHVVRRLRADGHGVAVLARDPKLRRELEIDGAEWIGGDLRDGAGVRAACVGMDRVVHAGALSSPWGRAADFHAVNVAGTEHVLAGCRESRVGRLVHISSPSVVFTGSDQWEVAEDAPYATRFLSIYSRTKKLAEDRVRASGVPAIVLRPKAIFGPGDRTLLPRLVASARRRRLPQVGDGNNLVDLTYVDNVVDAIASALDSDRAVGRTYHITNDEHVPLWEVIRSVLRGLELDTNLRRLPLRAAFVLARAMELRARLFGGEPLLTRYAVAILARTQTYDVRAARADLGYIPRITLTQGIERTIAAFRAEASRG